MAEGRAAEGRPRVGGWGRHVRRTTCRRGGKVEKRQGSPAGSPSGAAAECCALLAREGAWAARGSQGRRGDEAGTGPGPGSGRGDGGGTAGARGRSAEHVSAGVSAGGSAGGPSARASEGAGLRARPREVTREGPHTWVGSDRWRGHPEKETWNQEPGPPARRGC